MSNNVPYIFASMENEFGIFHKGTRVMVTIMENKYAKIAEMQSENGYYYDVRICGISIENGNILALHGETFTIRVKFAMENQMDAFRIYRYYSMLPVQQQMRA